MHGAPTELLSLAALLVGAVAMPLLSARIRVPSAVLLILFGLGIGPQTLDLVHDGTVVSFLYDFGFTVLMFLAGMEIDFNGIRSRGRRALLVVTAICATIIGLAFVTSALLGLPTIFGLALGAISVGLPLAVLRETGFLRLPLGQTVILLGSAGEFMTLIGVTLLYFSHQYGVSLELLRALGTLIGIMAIAGVSLRLAMAAAWWAPERLAALVESHDGSELGVRTALLLMVGFSAIATLAGVESIVGGFLAGALIAFILRGKEVLEEKLSVVGHGLFIPLFFIIVGLRFDPRTISTDTLLVAGQLVLAGFVVRLIPSLALIRQGLSPRQMLGAASLLATPLTLVVAIAALGREMGLLDQRAEGTLIVMAMTSAVIFPVVFRTICVAGPQGASSGAPLTSRGPDA